MFNIWNFWADKYDKLWVQKYSLKPTRNYIVKALSKYIKNDGIKVLDLGCGNCTPLFHRGNTYSSHLKAIDQSGSQC